MSDKIFIDTNVWVYLFSEDKKSNFARDLIESNFDNIVISTQVLNEFFNVIANKHKLKSKEETKLIIEELINSFEVTVVDTNAILKAIDVSIQFQLSYFDSLMVASAFIENCYKFHTEDMHSGLIINESLEIVNPFKV